MTATSGSFAEPSPTGPACTRRRPGYGEPERDPRGRGLPDRVAETAPPSPTIKEGAGGVGRLPRRARPTGHWGEFTLPDLPERISARELVRLRVREEVARHNTSAAWSSPPTSRSS